MEYDCGDSFPIDFEPNVIPFGSKSRGKLSPWSYPIQCERKWKYSFLSVHENRHVLQLIFAIIGNGVWTYFHMYFYKINNLALISRQKLSRKASVCEDFYWLVRNSRFGTKLLTVNVKVRLHWAFLAHDSWLWLENSDCLLVYQVSRPIGNIF